MNGWAAAAMAAGQIGEKAVSTMPGAASGGLEGYFDSSGWNVNFGAGRIDSQMEKTQSTTGALDAYMPYAVLFVGVMIVWRMTRKS